MASAEKDKRREEMEMMSRRCLVCSIVPSLGGWRQRQWENSRDLRGEGWGFLVWCGNGYP